MTPWSAYHRRHRFAAAYALNGGLQAYEASAMPAVTFTDPQAASVGLTKRQACDSGIEVKTSILPIDYVPRALAARDARGLIKHVADGSTGKLLGVHILASEGGEASRPWALAIKHGMEVSELAETIFFPTWRRSRACVWRLRRLTRMSPNCRAAPDRA